jgi:Uma2 family endonuclease
MISVMGVQTLVSLDEYLRTSYDPDMEYVDGVLVERNVGDWQHSLIQSNIIYALRRKYPRVFTVPELRSKTTETKYRLPDVAVLLSAPATKYLLDAAHIAIEILSEDDAMTKVLEKLSEYESKGVAHIWLVDPRLQTMSVYSAGNLVRTGKLSAGELELTSDEVFTS